MKIKKILGMFNIALAIALIFYKEIPSPEIMLLDVIKNGTHVVLDGMILHAKIIADVLRFILLAAVIFVVMFVFNLNKKIDFTGKYTLFVLGANIFVVFILTIGRDSLVWIFPPQNPWNSLYDMSSYVLFSFRGLLGVGLTLFLYNVFYKTAKDNSYYANKIRIISRFLIGIGCIGALPYAVVFFPCFFSYRPGCGIFSSIFTILGFYGVLAIELGCLLSGIAQVQNAAYHKQVTRNLDS